MSTLLEADLYRMALICVYRLRIEVDRRKIVRYLTVRANREITLSPDKPVWAYGVTSRAKHPASA